MSHSRKPATPIFILAPLALILLFLTTGCGLKDLLNPVVDAKTQAIDEINNAINDLSATNADWEAIIKDLENKLPAAIDSTIKTEIANTLTRAEATAGTEFRCGVDFVSDRAREHLIRVKAELLGQNPPPVEPVFCEVVPLAIDMNLDPSRRNLLEFYGYDMDTANVQVLVQNSGGLNDITPRLARPTHYHMTLDLGGNPNPLSAAAQKVILKWNGSEISSMSVIQPTTPVCQSNVSPSMPMQQITFTPPHVNGDTEFNGNGPEVNASVTLSVVGSGAQNHVNARVYMDARETKADWTEAEGTKDFTIYTAPPGLKIDKIVGATYSTYHYIDSTSGPEIDSFNGGSGEPVSTWEFVGDTSSSDDAGSRTRVNAYLNPLKVVLTQTANCVSPLDLDVIRATPFLSSVTFQRFQPALKQLDPNIIKLLPNIQKAPLSQ